MPISRALALAGALREEALWLAEPVSALLPARTHDAFFGNLPRPLRAIVFGMLRRQVERTPWGQGIGRHTDEEILAFGREDIDALAARLAGAPFFHGERPTSIDAALYPHILNTFRVPYETSLRRHAAASETLTAYCERCDAAFFGTEGGG